MDTHLMTPRTQAQPRVSVELSEGGKSQTLRLISGTNIVETEESRSSGESSVIIQLTMDEYLAGLEERSKKSRKVHVTESQVKPERAEESKDKEKEKEKEKGKKKKELAGAGAPD